MTEPTADLYPLESTETDWIEIRCAFPVQNAPVIPWREISAAIQLWRESGSLRQCFFTRKPPGLRLRLLPRSVEPALLDWLADRQRCGQITHFARAVYEPEEARFGGPAPMQIAHELWSTDSLCVFEYECLSAARRGSIPRVAVWALVLNDLLHQILDDRAEIWDVWQRIDNALSALDVQADRDRMDRYRNMAPSLVSSCLNAGLTPDLRRIIDRARTANRNAGSALLRLVESGMLSRGLRSWLASSALFQLNRWGLGLFVSELRALTLGMLEFLDPEPPRGLRNRDS